MDKQDKAKIEKWGTEIRVLEDKIEEIKQEDLDFLHHINKKAVGKCFQRGNTYMKIESSYGNVLFCKEINFDLTDLGIDDALEVNSLKEIEDDGYDEISLEVFDKHVKTLACDFIKGFFQVEK